MTAKFSESGARGLLLNNLPLDSNLDVLLETKQENSISNATCSTNANELSEETKNILNEFTSNMTIDELTSLQIAPDLGYFKKTRELETSVVERSFYNNFINELDNDIIDEVDENDENENLLNDRENLIADEISIASQNKSELDSVLSQQIEDAGPMNNNLNISANISNIGNYNHMSSFGGEGFSLFKHEDIKEHENQFGDGSRNVLKNIPQFQNFVKAFGQLDKNMFIRRTGVIKEEREGQKRQKKEEKLFVFSEDNEPNKNDIFSRESKVKKIDNIQYKKENKKKVKHFYNYDKLNVFKMFTIPDRTIYGNKIDKENKDGRCENNNNNDNIIPQDDIGDGMGDFNESERKNVSNVVESTFVRFDKEYEKKFGQLYKKFDVRYLKSKLWDTFEEIEEKKPEKVDFQKLISDMSGKIDKGVLGNISTSTCFVCFLHLCNEKNLELNQDSDQTFFITKNNNVI